jgi:hypothetical protein
MFEEFLLATTKNLPHNHLGIKFACTELTTAQWKTNVTSTDITQKKNIHLTTES